MNNKVTYIECDETKARYEHTYLNNDKTGFKKTELEVMRENLRKYAAQQKWENNKERIDLDEWIKQQVRANNAVFGQSGTSTMMKVLKLILAKVRRKDY